MLRSWWGSLWRYLALEHGRAVGMYKRVCRPSGFEWAEYLRRRGGLYQMGSACYVLPSIQILDPAYTSIGDRVILGTCTLICHDGSIQMLEQAHGVKLDRIGSIVIEDDVYIGQDAMVLGSDSVRIGKGSIIGAAAVVRQNVPAGSVVIGNPGKVVAKVADMIRFWEADSLSRPWSDIILKRQGSFDPALEPELQRLRQAYFFGAKGGAQP